MPAGPGARHKGDFALALADQLAMARDTGAAVTVPGHLRDLFDFLYPGPVGVAASEANTDAATTDAEPAPSGATPS